MIFDLGIVQEVNTEEEKINDNCIKMFCEQYYQQYPCEEANKMKSILFSKRLSRGPSHSQSYIESLMENEDFCLLSDSHIDVIQVLFVFYFLFSLNFSFNFSFNL